MADFRALLSDLGFTGVATLLNSGNAVFHAPRGTPVKHAAEIRAALARELNVEVPVVVKSAQELAGIVAECPIEAEATAHSRLLVAFVQEPEALSSLSSIAALVEPPERFAIGNRAAYLLCAKGILESRAGDALLGKAGKSATTRNWATVLKLAALAEDEAGRRVVAGPTAGRRRTP